MIELLKSTKDENVTKYIMCNRADADITMYGIGYKEVVCN
ncbi:hypothetical protein CLBEIC_45050 [Clostridium beijerinckii]|nr:hypothetical protein CLOBI_49350 [Clostridium beijerinckii]OOM66968.1 hypothetical protein CLBEIC_45050 [Clostridium beijerinckii]